MCLNLFHKGYFCNGLWCRPIFSNHKTVRLEANTFVLGRAHWEMQKWKARSVKRLRLPDVAAEEKAAAFALEHRKGGLRRSIWKWIEITSVRGAPTRSCVLMHLPPVYGLPSAALIRTVLSRPTYLEKTPRAKRVQPSAGKHLGAQDPAPTPRCSTHTHFSCVGGCVHPARPTCLIEMQEPLGKHRRWESGVFLAPCEFYSPAPLSRSPQVPRTSRPISSCFYSNCATRRFVFADCCNYSLTSNMGKLT
jgi:hypothetical protein